MDNQHKLIKGYRDLSQSDIDMINMIKEYAEDFGKFCEALSANSELDQRWVAIGKTHLQQGIMALVRAVAKPETF